MRMTRLFLRTLREDPADSDVESHRLLLRAGFIRPLAAGVFSYLPLAHQALGRIATVIRDEMAAIGGQELTMPVVHPADLWRETGRWYAIGSELGRFQDKNGRDMVLAMTHEEVVADLVRREITSYRQLPQLIYHIQTKWRDDPRPRAGLIRAREFTMLDSYSLDADEESLDRQYRAHYQAYFNIFHRCGLPVLAVGSDVGMMGGSQAHEFMYLTPIGEDTLMICEGCGYAANRQVAGWAKPPAQPEDLRPLAEIATPDTTTIEALANLLDIPTARTAKAVFMVATLTEGDTDRERFVFAVVRGDMDVNETKLTNAVGAKDMRPARVEEIRAVGAEPGYGSPVGVRDVILVVDDAAAASPNLVAGANRPGYHLLNTNYGRDYADAVVTDIAAARAGDPCVRCGAALGEQRGVETGNIFKLGTRYTKALGGNFLDRDGQSRPVLMGSYGIGLGRLLACVAEQHHDERGLIWPISIAPYAVHLVNLLPESSPSANLPGEIYSALQQAGISVLYDDRAESPGVKFADADLLGMPLRITVGERAIKAGGVELKRRDRAAGETVPPEQVVAAVRLQIATLEAELAHDVVAVPFAD